MTQTDQQNVPKLRFPGFEGEWKRTRFGEIIEIASGQVDPKTEPYRSMPHIAPDNIGSGTGTLTNVRSAREDGVISGKYAFDENALVYSKIRPNLNKVAKPGYSGICSADMYPIWGKTDISDADFLLQIMLDERFVSDTTAVSLRTGLPKINRPDLNAIKTSLPTLPEQRKIAGFLGAVDTKIAQLASRQRLLEDYKKGCMQQLFSQKIRFKDDDGNDFPDWEEKPLGTLLSECVEKSNTPDEFPVLSSTKDGVFLQKDYFRGRVASSDNTGYKILRPQQVVLSPQNLWLGNINFYDGSAVGIVSPSYKIFDIIEERGLPEFVRYTIRLPRMFYEYANASEQGASVVRRNLDMNLFNSIPISLPHPDEQRKIADFLSALDRKIDLVGQELTHARSFKQGLLQQMFV